MRKGLLLNGVVLSLLAVGLATGTIFAFSMDEQIGVSTWEMEGEMAFDVPVKSTAVSSARLAGRDSVYLLPGTEATLHYDATSDTVNVELLSGAVVFSTLSDDFQVMVQTPLARVESQHSTAYLALEESALQVYAITHPSLVNFTSNGKDLNALSVPSGYHMKVPSSKVTEVLERLRLAKLAKEFPIYLTDAEDLDETVGTVLTEVSAAYDKNALAFLNEAQSSSDFGPALTGFGATVYTAYSSVRDALTVLPTAEEELSRLRASDALQFAMTNFLYGDAAAAQQWLGVWKTLVQDPAEVQQLYSSLFFVLPGDALYPVKSAAAEWLYPQEAPLDSLRRQYGQIESLLNRASTVEAQQAYAEYQKQFEAALDAGAFDDPSVLSEVSREYHLLELLLRSNAVFYSKDATTLLGQLEEKILALADSGQDLDEERQAFIQSKLRFLDKLFAFVQEKKVDVKQATALANELIFEAQIYLNSIVHPVAVTEYFVTQLKDDQVSVEFINSPEFYSYTVFADGLAAYKAKQADLSELNAYIQNLRIGQEAAAPSMSLEAAQEAVEDALITHAIQFSKVVSLGDGANRLFDIQGARTAGYSFTAKYDRETAILYDVTVGDLRFSSGLKLDDVNAVIKAAMATQATVLEDAEDSEVQNEEVTVLGAPSLTEGVALNLVESQFTAVGLQPEDFVFTVVDLENNRFSFEGSMTAAAVPVSGSYDATTQRVSEVVWEFSGKPYVLPDIDLALFEGALEASVMAVGEQ